MAELVDWCHRHVPGEFVYHGWETIVFHTERAQVMFLLRWHESYRTQQLSGSD